MSGLPNFGPNGEAVAKLVTTLARLGEGEQRLVVDAQYGAVLDSPTKQQQAAADRVALGDAIDSNRLVHWYAAIDTAWKAADLAAEESKISPAWPLRLAARFAAEALVVADLLNDADYQRLIGPATATAALEWLKQKPA